MKVKPKDTLSLDTEKSKEEKLCDLSKAELMGKYKQQALLTEELAKKVDSLESILKIGDLPRDLPPTEEKDKVLRLQDYERGLRLNGDITASVDYVWYFKNMAIYKHYTWHDYAKRGVLTRKSLRWYDNKLAGKLFQLPFEETKNLFEPLPNEVFERIRVLKDKYILKQELTEMINQTSDITQEDVVDVLDATIKEILRDIQDVTNEDAL